MLRTLIYLSALTMTLGQFSFASTGSSNTGSVCTDCVQMRELKRQYDPLKYYDNQDFDRGANELWPKANVFFKAFESSNKPAKQTARFNELVQLIAAAIPYDVESDFAERLDLLLELYPTLTGEFERALNSVANKCNVEMLKYYMKEHHEKDDNPTEPTKPIFSYGECMKKQARLSKKAPASIASLTP